MESSAAGLLAELHGHCLRALGKVVGGEFDGLSTMARAALKRGLISALLKKKPEHLDIAVAFNRHAYDGKMRGFQDWLHAALSERCAQRRAWLRRRCGCFRQQCREQWL